MKMNETNNYENLWVCSAQWCINVAFDRNFDISRSAKEVLEISRVYLRTG